MSKVTIVHQNEKKILFPELVKCINIFHMENNKAVKNFELVSEVSKIDFEKIDYNDQAAAKSIMTLMCNTIESLWQEHLQALKKIQEQDDEINRLKELKPKPTVKRQIQHK